MAAMHEVRGAAMPSGASRRDMLKLYARNLVHWVPQRLPFAAMCIPEVSGAIRLPLTRFAEWGRALGVPVHVWTVNDAPTAERLWDAGVTGILGDDPELLLRVAGRAEFAGPMRLQFMLALGILCLDDQHPHDSRRARMRAHLAAHGG